MIKKKGVPDFLERLFSFNHKICENQLKILHEFIKFLF